MIPAFLLKPVAGWLAAGLVLAVMGGALWLEHGRRVNAEDAKRVAIQERDDARDSATRWKARSDQGDAAIARRDEALNFQSAEIEAMRARISTLDLIASSSAAAAEVARQAAADRAIELAAWAKANPDKVCRLSPEMKARAEAPYQ